MIQKFQKMLKIQCQINTAENQIIASSEYGNIQYSLPFESLPQLETYDFIVWGFLPIAMRLGIPLHIEGPISIQTLHSAREVSTVWAAWLPDLYQPVMLSAASIIQTPPANQTTQNLSFFSGGIDSTYSTYKAFLENGQDSDCLTVHGMDYKFDDHEKFQALMDQTHDFRSQVFKQSRVVKTDAYTLYSKYGCNPKGSHVTHIFSLFSCASIFEHYQQYRISADYRLDQQLFVHPYGSNTASNRLMKNRSGVLITLDDDVTRSQKTAFLSQSDLDLQTLSICVDYRARPKNCGQCSKCMRTKAMFYATSPEIPDIFLDRRFEKQWYQSIPLSSKINRAFLIDILSAVEKSSQQQQFPDYATLKVKVEAVSKRAAINPFYGMKIKDVLRTIIKIIFGSNPR